MAQFITPYRTSLYDVIRTDVSACFDHLRREQDWFAQNYQASSRDKVLRHYESIRKDVERTSEQITESSLTPDQKLDLLTTWMVPIRTELGQLKLKANAKVDVKSTCVIA